MAKRYLFLMVIGLILAALACNAPSSSDSEPDSEEESTRPQELPDSEASEADSPASNDQTDSQEKPQDIGSEDSDQSDSSSPVRPMGIRQGLASLDTFRVVMDTINNGPTDQDIDESHVEIRYNGNDSAQYMRTESVSMSAEFPEETRSIEEQYQIDLQSCTLSTYEGETDVETEEMTPLERDMVSSSGNLFDIIITAENSTLVGEETINGIPAQHYTYKITGLGDYSGEEVTQADGAYWLATDGQYLVRYRIVLEIRTGPEGDPSAEVMHMEYSYDLMDVNQPMTITLPAECVG